MKVIDFRSINSRNYSNNSANISSPPQQKKNKPISQEHKKPVDNRHQIIRNNTPNQRKHQTYQEAYDELNMYIDKVRNYTFEYIERKKKEKGFFGRLLSKILRIDEEEREEWIEEVSESPQIERWMYKIENLVDFIDDFYNKDLTDYVENKLGNLFPDYY